MASGISLATLFLCLPIQKLIADTMPHSYQRFLRKNALETFRLEQDHDGNEWTITIKHVVQHNNFTYKIGEKIQNLIVDAHDDAFVISHLTLIALDDLNGPSQALNIDSRDKLFEPGKWIRGDPHKLGLKRRLTLSSKANGKIQRTDKTTTEDYTISATKTFVSGLNTILKTGDYLVDQTKDLLMNGTSKSFLAHWEECKVRKVEAGGLYGQTDKYISSIKTAATIMFHIARLFTGFPQHYLRLETRNKNNEAFSWGKRTNRLVMLVSNLANYFGNVATMVFTLFAVTNCAKTALRRLSEKDSDVLFFLEAETAFIDVGLRRHLSDFKANKNHKLLGFNPVAFYDWYCDAEGEEYDSICKQPQYAGLVAVSREFFTELRYSEIAESIEARAEKLATGILPDISKSFIVQHAPRLAGFERDKEIMDSATFKQLTKEQKIASILTGTLDPAVSDVVDVDILYSVMDALLSGRIMQKYTSLSKASDDEVSDGTTQPVGSDFEDPSSGEDESTVGDSQSMWSVQTPVEEGLQHSDHDSASRDFTSQLKDCALNFSAPPNPMSDHNNDIPAGQMLSFMSDEELFKIMNDTLCNPGTNMDASRPMNGHEQDDPAGIRLSDFNSEELMQLIGSFDIPEATNSYMGNI